MRTRVETEVAVLSARNDLDLAITTWLPGYCAQRTDDLDEVMDITRRGGVVLVDLSSPRHAEWVSALAARGFDGPMVFLDPGGQLTLDLRERVVVPSPPSLSGLLSGFEVARSQQQARRRRRSRDEQSSTPGRSRGRAARTAVAPRAPGLHGTASATGSDVSPASEEASRVAPRARRVDRRNATQARASAGSPPRRFADAGSSGTGVAGAAVRPASARVDADAAQQFREVFRGAEAQPAVHRRIETPAGRVRVQTNEELFAGHAAAPSLATVLTLPGAGRSRQRRATIGA